MSLSRARPGAFPTSTPATAPDARWDAVQARDAGADGHFVYAVCTTGVYCRPSCPSRRPRREHVAFFAVPAGARAAGFRACRRCAPDAPLPNTTRADAAVAAARALLDAADREGADRRVSLAELARQTGVSAAHLQRAFTRRVGTSPARYAAALRAARLRGALRAERTVSAATYAAGYTAASRAYEAAAAHLGMTPAAYARGGAGVRLWWAAGDTPLGRALVAVTARGLCAAFLGDAAGGDADRGDAAGGSDLDAALAGELAAEFPRADRVRVALGMGPGRDEAADEAREDAEAAVARPRLAAALAAVAAAAGGELPAGTAAPANVALDLAGTAWQQQVWAALRAIPAGETRTYAELAAALGRPTAARALARACATNRVALVVPCHRVVPAGGGVGGYRWGPARKAWLLAAERGVAERRVAERRVAGCGAAPAQRSAIE